MSILKIGIVGAAILAIVGIFMPQDYSVSRELVIQAPASAIYQHVEDLDSWEQWATWHEAVPPAGNGLAQMESGVGSGKYLSGTAMSGWFIITNNSLVDGFEYAIYSDNGDKALAKVRLFDLGGETKVEWTIKGSVTRPPVLAPYIALSKEFILGSAISQNLKNLKKIVLQEDRG